MDEQQLKSVKDVFSDVELDEALQTAKIKYINLYKKVNQLVLHLLIIDKINLVSINKFEKYLKERFKVKDAKIVIENNSNFNIESEWKSIVQYINAK